MLTEDLLFFYNKSLFDSNHLTQKYLEDVIVTKDKSNFRCHHGLVLQTSCKCLMVK